MSNKKQQHQDTKRRQNRAAMCLLCDGHLQLRLVSSTLERHSSLHLLKQDTNKEGDLSSAKRKIKTKGPVNVPIIQAQTSTGVIKLNKKLD